METYRKITRIEKYLAKIIGEDVEIPEIPIYREEFYLAKIAGETVNYLPVPITRIDKYLAKIAGETVDLPAPITRIDRYLANIAGEDVELPARPLSEAEKYLAQWAEQGGGTEVTVTGISPLALLAAKAKPIIALTQTGKCEQETTPTPASPVDIYCNNGKLVMVDDELPSGYKRVLGFQCNDNAMWQITNFHLRGSDTVKISFSIAAACNVFGCYQGTSADDNYDLYASIASGSKYFRYANGTYLSYFSNANLNTRFDVIYTPSGSTGMPEDSTWTPREFTSANNLLIGSTTVTGTSAKLKGKLYGDFIVLNGTVERLHLIPCERVSDNVLGYYDKVGGAFYEPYTGFTGAVSLGYDGSHYRLAVDGDNEVLWIDDGNILPPNAEVGVKYPVSRSGSCIISCDVNNGSNVLAVEVHYYKADNTQINYYTLSSYDDTTHRMYKSFSLPSTAAYVSIERKPAYATAVVANAKLQMGSTPTPYVVPQTAGAVNLFAVGDFADEQEIISGAVKRKVGVWVLTGEESWTVASTNSDVYYLSSANLPDDYGIAARFTPICSHLEGTLSTVSITSMGANTIKTNNSSKIVYACVGATYTTKEAWKAFIAAQYAQGTPVVILYPLAEETTETATPQPLTTNAGDNTITVAACVADISLDVTYIQQSA